MIIHIGSDEAVNLDDIVMILNLNGEKAAAHEEWLAQMRSEGRVRVLEEDGYKCAVIVSKKGKSARQIRALLSPVNPQTIVRRETLGPWQEDAQE